MNLARHFFAQAVALFSLFLLFAAKTGNTAERGLEKVRIAVSSKSLGFLDTWAAKERGFYRKHGLDAEIIAMRPPLTIALSRPAKSIMHSAPARSHAAVFRARRCGW